ncbi:fumarylacetoacetate hydrolase family protein [Paraburkholderia silviterrae]
MLRRATRCRFGARGRDDTHQFLITSLRARLTSVRALLPKRHQSQRDYASLGPFKIIDTVYLATWIDLPRSSDYPSYKAASGAVVGPVRHPGEPGEPLFVGAVIAARVQPAQSHQSKEHSVMKICRFGSGRLGVVEGERVYDVTSALDVLPSSRYPFPAFDVLVANLPQVRERIEALLADAVATPLAEVSLLSPVANPGKIVAAPVNYTKHLLEVMADRGLNHGNLVEQIEKVGLFLKASSSVVGAAEGVQLRKLERRNDHEVELAVVIGKPASNVSREDALDYVAGYCIGLDMTVRGGEERSLRKSLDTYTVLGPWLVTADELPEPGALDLAIRVNGQARQSANTRDLIMDVPALIEFASSFYTLMPGDVILTGTPDGVGPVRPGDVMEASIEGIGRMVVNVSTASA